jgi:hypothetical protein
MPRRSRRPSSMGLLLMLLIFFHQGAFSHKQPVHQYIAREGYLLLLQSVGHDIPSLSASIGLADPSFAGDSAWQKGYITAGAWREDEEDVVYRYDVLPGLVYPLSSITHFWDADQGDYTGNIFRLMVDNPPWPPVETDIGPFSNAFDKLMHSAHGGWVLWYPRAIICQNTSNSHYIVITPFITSGGFGIPLEYDGLTSFYASMKLKVRADQSAACIVFDLNDMKSINLSDLTEITVQEEVRNIVVWEILGRMCHLLGDMSVPAHAHRDEHGLSPDSYEDYVGGPGDPYKQWDHSNAGAPILLNGVSDESLHFLMYVTQQVSDHFGSNGPADGDGNDLLGGNPTQPELDFLNAVNLGSLGGPTTDAGPWTTENLNLIRDKTMPLVIRATAGLLYWFCRQTGLVESVTEVAAGEIGPAQPAQFSLMQNYPNPFNPRTLIKYTVGGNRGCQPAGGLVGGLGVSDVSLVVYDVLGRQVAVLVNERKTPGSYEVYFDGSGLASGMYIYRLSAGTFVQARRMILVR